MEPCEGPLTHTKPLSARFGVAILMISFPLREASAYATLALTGEQDVCATPGLGDSAVVTNPISHSNPTG